MHFLNNIAYSGQNKIIIPKEYFLQVEYVGQFTNVGISSFDVPDPVVLDSNTTVIEVTNENETVVTEPETEPDPYCGDGYRQTDEN